MHHEVFDVLCCIKHTISAEWVTNNVCAKQQEPTSLDSWGRTLGLVTQSGSSFSFDVMNTGQVVAELLQMCLLADWTLLSPSHCRHLWKQQHIWVRVLHRLRDRVGAGHGSREQLLCGDNLCKRWIFRCGKSSGQGTTFSWGSTFGMGTTWLWVPSPGGANSWELYMEQHNLQVWVKHLGGAQPFG